MTFFQAHWDEMTPIQREQYHVLVALIRELRTEVVERVAERENISLVEPVLASPRSSLNPHLVGADA